jgi:hypothetical protein
MEKNQIIAKEEVKGLLEQDIVTPATKEESKKETKQLKRHFPKLPFTIQAFEVVKEGTKDEKQTIVNEYSVTEIVEVDGIEYYCYNAMTDYKNEKKSFTAEDESLYTLFPVECAKNPVSVKFQRVQRNFSPLPTSKGLIRVRNEGKKSTTYYFKVVKPNKE